MRLLTNNPAKRAGLEGYGLSISARVPLETEPTPENIGYLRTKREKLGHLLDGLADDARRPGRSGRAVSDVRGPVRAASGRRIAIVAARFNEASPASWSRARVAGLDLARVSRPMRRRRVGPRARSRSRSSRDGWRAPAGSTASICLGAVIRGETAHFDLVANEAARGIADAARDTGVPVIFEVLATDNLAQAEDRAGGRTATRAGRRRRRCSRWRRSWRSCPERDRLGGASATGGTS